MTMRRVVKTYPAHIRLSRLCIILLLIACLSPQKVRADMGPKPSAAFIFTWETEDQPTIVEGQLLQCQDAACVDAQPLENLGPQHFACTATACDSMAYGYAPYAKLVLVFSDGVTRESKIFEKATFNSQFEVTVRSSDLVVTEKGTDRLFAALNPVIALVKWVEVLFGSGMVVMLFALSILMIIKTKQPPLLYASAKITCISVWVITLPAFLLGIAFAPTLPLTLAIEGVLISLYTLIKKYRWFPWATVVTLGNLFTQVLMLTTLTLTSTQGIPILITAFLEIFIWLCEAVLIHLTLRRHESIFPSLGISLVLNAVSMGIGMLLPV